jgi:hypothetical protein
MESPFGKRRAARSAWPVFRGAPTKPFSEGRRPKAASVTGIPRWLWRNFLWMERDNSLRAFVVI